MGKLLTILFLAALLLGIGAVQIKWVIEAYAVEEGNISGNVVNVLGQGVGEAYVYCEGNGIEVTYGPTDHCGEYSFVLPVPGTYTVWAENGFAESGKEEVTLTPQNPIVEHVDLILYASGPEDEDENEDEDNGNE